MSHTDSVDLDDLIASLNPGSSRSSMAPSKPVPQRAVAAATMNDLDDLLMGLESNRSSVAPPSRVGNTSSSSGNTSNYNQPSSYNSQPSSYNNSSYNSSPSYGSNNSQPVSKPSYSAIQMKPAPTSSAPSRAPASGGGAYGGGGSYGGGVSSQGGGGQRGPLAGDALDDMLKGLVSGSVLAGSNPTARGTCAQCRKPILGEIISALGRTFHPEHFVCANCTNPLGTQNFHEEQGVPHCEKCYLNLFCGRCAHCNEPILERALVAQGKKWHEGHFVCTQCLKPLANGSYMEKDDRAYCDGCFHNVFLPRCASCSEPIKGEVTNALGQQWHPNHFVCQSCQKPFTGGQFFELAGKPFCETHYHQQKGSLCGGCGKAITGRSVDACNQKWHPEHLVCAYCTTQLAGSSFTENNGRVYCRDCNGKLFG